MSDLTIPPPFDYIAHIDEAGDPGIRRVRPKDNPGASEWFVLGCSLIETGQDDAQAMWTNDILNTIKLGDLSVLHFRGLGDTNRSRVCERLAGLPVTLFVVASNKKNMKGHKNVRAAARSQGIPIDQVFYNWCVRLILERVTHYCYQHSIRKHGGPRYVKVLLAERGTHGYARAIWYGQMLKDQSKRGETHLSRRTIRWQVFDSRLIQVLPAQWNPGLQLADIVASSFYQSVDVLPPTRWNPENACLLMPRVAKYKHSFENYGLMFLPFNYWEAELRPEQIDIFEAYGFHRFDFAERPHWW